MGATSSGIRVQPAATEEGAAVPPVAAQVPSRREAEPAVLHPSTSASTLGSRGSEGQEDSFAESFALILGLPHPTGVNTALGRRATLVGNELERQGFTVVDKVLGEDATKEAVLAALGKLADVCGVHAAAAPAARMRVLVYIMGVAATMLERMPADAGTMPASEVAVPVLCCAGASFDDPGSCTGTCISFHRLGLLIRHTPASHQMLVFDGCKGASLLATQLISPAAALAGQYVAGVPVVTLEKAGPVVDTPSVLHQPSIVDCLKAPAVCVLGCDLTGFPSAPVDLFTRAFVAGLAGKAFIKDTGFLTASLLFAYVHSTVTNQLGSKSSARASLVRPPSPPFPTPPLDPPQARAATIRTLASTFIKNTPSFRDIATNKHILTHMPTGGVAQCHPTVKAAVEFGFLDANHECEWQLPAAPPEVAAESTRPASPPTSRVSAMAAEAPPPCIAVVTVFGMRVASPGVHTPNSVASGGGTPVSVLKTHAAPPRSTLRKTVSFAQAPQLDAPPAASDGEAAQPPAAADGSSSPSAPIQAAPDDGDAAPPTVTTTIPDQPPPLDTLLSPEPQPHNAVTLLPSDVTEGSNPQVLVQEAVGGRRWVPKRSASGLPPPTSGDFVFPRLPLPLLVPRRCRPFSQKLPKCLAVAPMTVPSTAPPSRPAPSPPQNHTRMAATLAVPAGLSDPRPPFAQLAAWGGRASRAAMPRRSHRRILRAVTGFVGSGFEETRVCVVHGPPGCGKSEIAAQVFDQLAPHAVARVFLGPRSTSGVGRCAVSGFVRSVAYQLFCSMPAYAQVLSGMGAATLRSLVEADNPVALFAELLRKPLAAMHRPSHAVAVVVDGIDQVLPAADGCVADVPGRRPSPHPLLAFLQLQWLRMPIWLGLVVTATDVAAVHASLGFLAPKYLAVDGLDHRQNVDAFIMDVLRLPETPGDTAPDLEVTLPVMGTLCDKARGSFLYAELALQYAAWVGYDMKTLEQLPQTLAGLYSQVFSTLVMKAPPRASSPNGAVSAIADAVRAWTDDGSASATSSESGSPPPPAVTVSATEFRTGGDPHQPHPLWRVLEVILAAQAPLTALSVGTCLQPPLTHAEVLALCDTVAPLLYVATDDTVRPAFVSLAEWLQAEACPNSLRVDVGAGHAVLSHTCLRELRPRGVDAVEDAPASVVWSKPLALDVARLLPVVEASTRLCVRFLDAPAGEAAAPREEATPCTWPVRESTSMVAYALLNSPAHLRVLEDTAQLCRLLCGADYMQLAHAAGMGPTYARELHLAVATLPAMPSWLRARFRAFAAASNAHARQLARHPQCAQEVAAGIAGKLAPRGSVRALPPLGATSPAARQGGVVVAASSHKARVSHRPEALLFTLQGHKSAVNAVAFACEGGTGEASLVVSGSDDELVKVWNVKTGELWNTLHGHGWGVKGVAVLRDGSRAVTGSWDGTVRVWSLGTGKCVTTLRGNLGYIRSVAASATGSRVVAGSLHPSARVFNGMGHVLATLRGHLDTVSGVAVSADGSYVLTCSDDASVRVWSPTTGRCMQRFNQKVGVEAVAVSDDGLVVAGSWDGTVTMWRIDTGARLCVLRGHTSWVTCVAVSADGARVVSGGEDRSVRVWDVQAATGRLTGVTVLEGHTDEVSAVALSGDCNMVASGSKDGTVRVWELRRA